MIKSLRVTLYEVFGYLLPGCLVLVAVVVVAWAVFWGEVPLNVGAASTTAGLLGLIGAYFLGHAAQALGNCFCRFWPDPLEQLTRADHPASELVSAVRSRLAEGLCLEQSAINTPWLFKILDQEMVRLVRVDDRDLFVYREGFYRGSAVGLFVLALALIIRAIVPGTALLGIGSEIALPAWFVILIAVVAAISGLLSVKRWRRFTNHGIENALAAYLAQWAAEALSPPVADDPSRKEDASGAAELP